MDDTLIVSHVRLGIVTWNEDRPPPLGNVEREIRPASDGAKWPRSLERVILRGRSLGPRQGLQPGETASDQEFDS